MFQNQLYAMRLKIKAKLHQILEEKTHHFENIIADLRTSNNETKSSMGDKYETSREMLQQEIMRLQQQLANVQQQKAVLHRMREIPGQTIGFGSVITTSVGNFVLAISIGRFKVSEKEYFGISEQTPLAKQLIGKKKGEVFTFQQKEVKILDVD